MDWFHVAMSVRPLFLVWAVVLMAGILISVLRPVRRRELEDYRHIPLNDDRNLP